MSLAHSISRKREYTSRLPTQATLPGTQQRACLALASHEAGQVSRSRSTHYESRESTGQIERLADQRRAELDAAYTAFRYL